MPPLCKGGSYNTTQDLTSVTDPEGAITSLGYDSFGNVTSVTRGSSITRKTMGSLDSLARTSSTCTMEHLSLPQDTEIDWADMNKLIIITIIFVVLAVLFFISLEKFPTYLLEPAQVKTLVSAANNGDKDAMWDLYFHIEESGKKEQALYWLHKGASSGDSRALYWIYSLQKDSSIQTERNEAFESLKLAAEGGDSFAALQLGKQYIDGRIVNHDVESGKKWLKFAVSDGNIEAMLVLGNTMVLNCTE